MEFVDESTGVPFVSYMLSLTYALSFLVDLNPAISKLSKIKLELLLNYKLLQDAWLLMEFS